MKRPPQPADDLRTDGEARRALWRGVFHALAIMAPVLVGLAAALLPWWGA